ncbi:hypothetical protein J2X05_000564 [Cellvibrio fibrivorans]|uniref:ATP-grasp domain-containing protein n=2 Tax=Cellvibrio fibrivorans TaxID=126350 RepID=A0ABU1UTR0_9GAMM|nr:hypothetical protein [Cellvibrio fibrivorans]
MSPLKRVGIIHAYPSQYMIDSITRTGIRVVLVVPEDFDSVIDGVEHVIRAQFTDYASLYESICNLSNSLKIDAFIPLNEGTVIQTARINADLGLKGYSVGTAVSSRNKFSSFLLWNTLRISCPESYLVYDADSAWSLAKSKFGGRGVLKLVDSMNSQGVISFATENDCIAAFTKLNEMVSRSVDVSRLEDRNRFAYGLSNATIMLQEYCAGKEVSVELFLSPQHGDLALAVLEKIPSSGPYFAETASYSPASLTSLETERVVNLAIQGVRAMGFTQGVAHVEIRYDGDTPKILEAGLRPGGGYTAQLVERLTGNNLYALLAQLSCNVDFDFIPVKDAAQSILFGGVVYQKSGNLISVKRDVDIDSIPGLEKLIVLNSVGDPVRAMPESAQPHYCYYLISGTDRDQILESHYTITKSIHIEIE